MTLPGYKTYTPTPQRRSSLAVASLVLGLAGLPALFLCGTGMLLAAAGLVAGIMAVLRTPSRGLALGGIAASVVTLAVGAVAIFWLLAQAAECADRSKYPDDAATQQCIEREFPFAQTTSAP